MLSACAGIDGDYWSRQGLSQQTLDMDGRACTQAALETNERTSQFITCMTTKGYHLRNFTSDQRYQMQQMSPAERSSFRRALMAEAYIGRSVIYIPADPVIGE